ncbi:MAG: winged helix-turn-helix domain-containing protein [Clostridiales bacterium]|nr:winged helix-turn-helix domain-containing protein [Clostridiales bacterium]
MSSIDTFTNDNFRVLSYLYDNKNKDNLVKITQTELSKELALSRGTINSIFKQLKEKDYLIHDDSRVGRYYLTGKAVNVVEMFRKTK